MEGLIIVDTCALLDFLAGMDKDNMVGRVLNQGKAAVSVITVFELFRGVDIPKYLTLRDDLIHLCAILDLTEPICRKASEIYTSLKKRGELISNEDILIAATAIHWKCSLLTFNKKYFQRIHSLEIFPLKQ